MEDTILESVAQPRMEGQIFSRQDTALLFSKNPKTWLPENVISKYVIFFTLIVWDAMYSTAYVRSYTTVSGTKNLRWDRTSTFGSSHAADSALREGLKFGENNDLRSIEGTTIFVWGSPKRNHNEISIPAACRE